MTGLGVVLWAKGKMVGMPKSNSVEQHQSMRGSGFCLAEGSHATAGLRVRLLGLLLVTLVSTLGPDAHAACGDSPRPGVDWTGCEKPRLILRGVNLAGARLSDADFNGTDFQRANLSGADLTHASVDRARLSGADLSRAKLVQLNGYRANMAGAVLVGADLTKAEMARANLALADLSRANLRKAEFQRTNLEGSKLDGANMTGADLARTVLTGASLEGTRLAQARTFRTRLEGVNLSAVVGLTQLQLDMACGDAATRLPAGLRASTSWPCGADD